MIYEVMLILPLYLGIFVIYFRFSGLIKAMTEAKDILSELFEESVEIACNSAMSKREFLLEKLINGESISNSKTPWTKERLEKASDKVVEKLYENYRLAAQHEHQNPLPVKINKKDALEMGKPVCPVVIEMYAEGLKSLMDQIPYLKGRYTINSEKLKTNISSNKLFCDNLAIKIGSKMIERMGENTTVHVGVSLAAMTWDAVEKAKVEDSKIEENKIE